MQVTGNNNTNYSLSIRVTADGFSFSVTEANSGDPLYAMHCGAAQLAGRTLAEALAEALKEDELHAYAYARVRVIMESNTTCIPRQEFNADALPALYSLVFPTSADARGEEVAYTHLPQLDLVLLYTIPAQVRETILATFPEASFTTSFAVVLGRIATYFKRRQLQDSNLFAYVTQRQLFLYSIAGDRLLFANSFLLQDDVRDALYYLLSVWKQLSLDALSHCCYIAGEKEYAAPFAEEVRKYLKIVQPVTLINPCV